MSLPKRLQNAWKKFKEDPDLTPHSLPVKLKRPLTLSEEVAKVIRMQRMIEAINVPGVETFEESNDFDIPDDPDDPKTPWEEDYEGKFDEEIAMERQLYEPDPREKGARVRRAPTNKKQTEKSDRDSVRSHDHVQSNKNDVRSEKNDVQAMPARNSEKQHTVHST